MTTELEDRTRALRERLETDYPEAWRPETGQSVVGTFARLERGRTTFGPAWIVVLADAGTGAEVSVWLLHKALLAQFKRLSPVTGELVAVKYKGKRRPESGGPEYDDYRVEVDRDTSANWEMIAPDEFDDDLDVTTEPPVAPTPAPTSASSPPPLTTGPTGGQQGDDVPF